MNSSRIGGVLNSERYQIVLSIFSLKSPSGKVLKR